MRVKRKSIFSIFRRKIDDQNYEHDAVLNRNLDTFSIKLIKAVGLAATIIGIAILVAFWYWVIKMLFKIG
jgi:hypothetical protein